MAKKRLAKGYQKEKEWGKYRLDLEGYVHTIDGKMLFQIDDPEEFQRLWKMRPWNRDREIEKELKERFPKLSTSEDDEM